MKSQWQWKYVKCGHVTVNQLIHGEVQGKGLAHRDAQGKGTAHGELQGKGFGFRQEAGGKTLSASPSKGRGCR